MAVPMIWALIVLMVPAQQADTPVRRGEELAAQQKRATETHRAFRQVAQGADACTPALAKTAAAARNAWKQVQSTRRLALAALTARIESEAAWKPVEEAAGGEAARLQALLDREAELRKRRTTAAAEDASPLVSPPPLLEGIGAISMNPGLGTAGLLNLLAGDLSIEETLFQSYLAAAEAEASRNCVAPAKPVEEDPFRVPTRPAPERRSKKG